MSAPELHNLRRRVRRAEDRRRLLAEIEANRVRLQEVRERHSAVMQQIADGLKPDPVVAEFQERCERSDATWAALRLAGLLLIVLLALGILMAIS